LTICSLVGLAEGEGAGDLADAGLLIVGADDGAGAWPWSCAANKIEIAVTLAQLNITQLLAARCA
jgi:hypothetical protein